jgi:hypothetical protein
MPDIVQFDAGLARRVHDALELLICGFHTW